MSSCTRARSRPLLPHFGGGGAQDRRGSAHGYRRRTGADISSPLSDRMEHYPVARHTQAVDVVHRPNRGAGGRSSLGCFFATSRELWHELGRFDEVYRHSWGDLDLFWRASRTGATVWFEPGARGDPPRRCERSSGSAADRRASSVWRVAVRAEAARSSCCRTSPHGAVLRVLHRSRPFDALHIDGSTACEEPERWHFSRLRSRGKGAEVGAARRTGVTRGAERDNRSSFSRTSSRTPFVRTSGSSWPKDRALRQKTTTFESSLRQGGFHRDALVRREQSCRKSRSSMAPWSTAACATVAVRWHGARDSRPPPHV